MQTLLKYKSIKLLIDGDADANDLLSHLPDIERYQTLIAEYVDGNNKNDQERKALANKLSHLKKSCGVFGFPFDTQDAELYALDRSIDYEVFEIHGNKGNNNAAKVKKASSNFAGRCDTADKNAWVKAAQKNGQKLTEFIISACNEKVLRDHPKFIKK